MVGEGLGWGVGDPAKNVSVSVATNVSFEASTSAIPFWLSVTTLLIVLTETTVVEEAIPSPYTLLPTTMEAASAKGIPYTIVLPEEVYPVVVTVVPEIAALLKITVVTVSEACVVVVVVVAALLSVIVLSAALTAVTVVTVENVRETVLPELVAALLKITVPVAAVKVRETAVPSVVAAVLSVTVLVAADEPTVTATTVVPEAIPVPDTVLPTTIEEADVTDVTDVLKVRVPVEVVTTPAIVYVGDNVGAEVGALLGEALGNGVGAPTS